MNNQRNGRWSNLCFRRLLSVFVLLGVVGSVSTLAWSQVTSGSLTGLVTDPTGAVVPEAKVIRLLRDELGNDAFGDAGLEFDLTGGSLDPDRDGPCKLWACEGSQSDSGSKQPREPGG